MALLDGITSQSLAAMVNDDNDWQSFFASLSDEEKIQLHEELEGKNLVSPTIGPQSAAYYSKADICGYGGAGGGGKSALAVMLALLEHQRTMIYRSDAQQCSNLVDDLAYFSGTDKGLSRKDKIFRLADRPGHIVKWAGLNLPGEEMKHKGHPFDLIIYEEATELRVDKVLFTMGWARTVKANQRVRILMTFNPPGGAGDASGGGGRWVIDYFAPWVNVRHPNPAKDGELRYFYNDAAGNQIETLSPEPVVVKLRGVDTEIIPKSRTFFHAKVQDNPYLMKTGYDQALLSLEAKDRDILYFGDFNAGISDNPTQILPTHWVDEAMERWDEKGVKGNMDSIGLDVARGGADKTVFVVRHGVWFDKLRKFAGKETPDGNYIMSIAAGIVRDKAQINIDANGVGSAPHDLMKNAGLNVYGVMGQRKADDMVRLEEHMEFYNLRSWLWWLMRKILDPANGMNACLPKDNMLRSELTTVMSSYVNGKWAAEPKEKVKERMRYSPDSADALMYSLINFFDTGGFEEGRLHFNEPEVKFDSPINPISKRGSSWMSN